MKIVPATLKLLEEYYGSRPPVTMRAFVLLDMEKPVGVAGFLRMTSSTMAIFSEGKPEVFEHHKVTIMKMAKMMMQIADANGWTLVADPDKDIQSASKFLEHLGFESNGEGGYVR